MPTNTYVALDTRTITTATPSITFTGISGAYTDLVVVATSANTSAATNMTVQVNGDTGSNYSRTRINGSGTTATSSRNSTETRIYVGDVGNPSVPSVNTLHFMNYSNATTFKTVLGRYGEADIQTGAIVGLWRSTAAITSITINSDSNNFAVGSTFSLYGIAASSVGAKATGGTIYTDSQYFYHVFSGSGTFTPTQSITADCLVVAGGGGGGRTVGGGGGAGGLLGFTSQSLTATGYTVTIGGGGAGATAFTVSGSNGVDSQFGSLTLVKGGGGAGSYSSSPSTGGSGGGAGSSGSGASTSVSGQGYAGGNAASGNVASGGGGGSGAVGSNGTASAAGNGGVGLSTYSSWGTATGIGQNVSGTYYLGGGGGGGSNSTAGASAGTGGLGGGAAGRAQASAGVPTAATANTGGGGGGSGGNGDSSNGGNGGSGVVIIRYLKA
jgi:hypothetical protein